MDILRYLVFLGAWILGAALLFPLISEWAPIVSLWVLAFLYYKFTEEDTYYYDEKSHLRDQVYNQKIEIEKLKKNNIDQFDIEESIEIADYLNIESINSPENSTIPNDSSEVIIHPFNEEYEAEEYLKRKLEPDDDEAPF